MATRIYIDQGHNPESPNAGAEGNGLREQDLVFRIGIELERLLRADPNFEARLSRPTSQTQLGNSNVSSLRARVDDANRWGADLFLSLHCNSSAITAASGSEALVYARNSTAYTIAEILLETLTQATGLRNRGVLIRPGLYVLRKTTMPAVLLELGFISNPSDAALLRDNPALFATGIYNGLLLYYA